MQNAFFDIQAQYQAHKAEFDHAIQTVLNSGQFIMGPQVHELEQQLETYTGANHCISCANGTDALQIALMAIGIQSNDEVITTPFTFAATVEAIILLGAKPIFVDIQEDSFLLNPQLISEKITDKTKAIIPVSLYGQIADMDEINAIAEEYSKKLGHKIYVIEDAAQSFGAEYKSRKSCNVSELAITSFFPTKPLGCFGDGGAIFTGDDELANIIRQIRVHGEDGRYRHVRLGINSRLDTIQAAVLQVKLKYFDNQVELRQQIAETYNRQYANSDIITPIIRSDRNHVYGQYTVRVNDRRSFIEMMKAKGEPTAIHYPTPLNKQPAYLDISVDCPVSDRLSKETVSLPMRLYE